MAFIDFTSIVEHAWLAYDDSREIDRISDISAQVSTNHVYRVTFKDKGFIIAKLSYFGKFEHFVEDHTIINVLANNLPEPFENFLARSLIKGNTLYVYHHKEDILDAWVVFYRPIQTKKRPPKILNEEQIVKLARQFARFHQACNTIRNTLPRSTKTLQDDIHLLLNTLDTDAGKYQFGIQEEQIRMHCCSFLRNMEALETYKLHKIPVFIDWNIGNFSVTKNFEFYSRWDYDWFRISYRMLDFYFISRVVSAIGDRTVFSYLVDPLKGDRFKLFLKYYHEVYPLKEVEVRLLKEVYRFFILNYVIKDGKYFFHEIFATRLQQEAYETYLPSIETDFNPEILLDELKITA